jgi:hypothetical protein
MTGKPVPINNKIGTVMKYTALKILSIIFTILIFHQQRLTAMKRVTAV